MSYLGNQNGHQASRSRPGIRVKGRLDTMDREEGLRNDLFQVDLLSFVEWLGSMLGLFTERLASVWG